MNNAIYGNDGATGLFARKVRIDYERHGAPLFVVVWATGQSTGAVIRPDATAPSGIAIAEINADAIERFEAAGGALVAELQQYF